MQIMQADLDKKGEGVEVSFIALLPSTGWSDIGLSIPEYFIPPQDGVQDVILCATPPTGTALTMVVPFPVTAVLPKTDWLQGVRIKNRNEEPIITLRTPVRECAPVGQDMVAIQGAGLSGDKLFVDVLYGGGCGPHRLQLNWDGTIRKSNPPQIVLELSHDGSLDPCKGIVPERLQFDLSVILDNDPESYVIAVTSGTSECIAHQPR